MSQLPFRENLENFNDPEEVRRRLAAGKYNREHTKIAQEFLDSLDRQELAKSSARSESREEESLSISRKALRIAERAFVNSKWANIWSAIATLIATIAVYIAYVSINNP